MLQIWVDGKPHPNAALVHITEGRNYLEEDYAEPVPLESVEAAMRYVQAAFPDGWTVVDGQVVQGCHHAKPQLQESCGERRC